LNITVPGLLPKLLPLIVTAVPTGPEFGDNPLIVGEGSTVNNTPLLETPFATTTFPVIAPLGTGTIMELLLQVVGVPATPLKLTTVEPCVELKLDPLIVTEAPTAPEDGDRLVIAGAGTSGIVTRES
jgi:hypothetical protein